MTSAKGLETKSSTVLFICSPSLGLLDNWLPVIFSLRKRTVATEFIFLAPKLRTIQEIHLESPLIKMSEPIFDMVFFPDSRGNWVKAESLSEAKALAEAIPRLVSTNRGLRKFLISLGLIAFASRVFRALAGNRWTEVTKGKDFLQRFLGEKNIAVLFDVYEAEKDYLKPLLALLKSAPKFSISHGVAIHGLQSKHAKSLEKPTPDQNRTENAMTIAFLFSNKERAIYREAYNLGEHQIEVTGIPRHEKKWVEKIGALNERDAAYLSRKFIFVISRPSTTTYFPRDRKLEAIRDVKKAAEMHDLFVVVKAHPKEADDGTFEEVFGAETHGVTWSTTHDHAFSLGKNCEFAVSFFSGVAVDMVMLGTPVIERLDLRGLRGHDSEAALRDDTGHPVFQFRFLGLVLGASDTQQFLDHVGKVVSDRDQVVRELQGRYNSLFPNIEGVNEKMSAQILAALGLEPE